MTDAEVLSGQYADDRNLRARQRLWEISRSEPALDFNRWSVALTGSGVGDLVLDAGCGNGRVLALLRGRGCRAIGLDLSWGMASSTQAAAVVVGDVQCLPSPSDVFDAAVALMMLYHVPDQEAAVAELRRVVRPGGVMVATTASQDNQVELRAIIEDAVGEGWTWQRPSATSFHLEGGAAVLGTAFEEVTLVEAPERRIFITNADAMADYVASSGQYFDRTLPAGHTWDDVVEAVRAATLEAVAADGALVVTGRLGALVCR